MKRIQVLLTLENEISETAIYRIDCCFMRDMVYSSQTIKLHFLSCLAVSDPRFRLQTEASLWCKLSDSLMVECAIFRPANEVASPSLILELCLSVRTDFQHLSTGFLHNRRRSPSKSRSPAWRHTSGCDTIRSENEIFEYAEINRRMFDKVVPPLGFCFNIYVDVILREWLAWNEAEKNTYRSKWTPITKPS